MLGDVFSAIEGGEERIGGRWSNVWVKFYDMFAYL